MKITTYGTRGSIPVAGAEFAKTGGNTTCLRLQSDCLPGGTCLALDAGSGFIPLNRQAMSEEIDKVLIFFTHYHHDHTQGLLLAPWTYMKSSGLRVHLYGPAENKVDPRKMLEHLMQPPYHPIDFKEVSSHMVFKGIEHPAGMVFLIHPEGGDVLCPLDQFERADQVTFLGGKRYSN